MILTKNPYLLFYHLDFTILPPSPRKGGGGVGRAGGPFLDFVLERYQKATFFNVVKMVIFTQHLNR